MTRAPGRMPPADPNDIQLTYHHRHYWADTPSDAVERWHVSADIADNGNGDSPHVGDFDLIIVDVYETDDPIGLLDGEEIDLGEIATAVFDPRTGELRDDLDELVEPLGERLLILNGAQLVSDWRGFGLGPVLVGAILRKLSGGARAAVCYPAPPGGSKLDQPTRKRAVNALQRTWEQLGFTQFRDGVYVLNLHTVALEENMEALSERVTALWPLGDGSA